MAVNTVPQAVAVLEVLGYSVYRTRSAPWDAWIVAPGTCVWLPVTSAEQLIPLACQHISLIKNIQGGEKHGR